MARRKPDLNNALAYIGIAVNYAILIGYWVTPTAQPCGDQTTIILRLGMTFAMFILLFFVAAVGRQKAFWLAPQVLTLALLLLTLPQDISLLSHAQQICVSSV